jgi:hypothetical protein
MNPAINNPLPAIPAFSAVEALVTLPRSQAIHFCQTRPERHAHPRFIRGGDYARARKQDVFQIGTSWEL